MKGLPPLEKANMSILLDLLLLRLVLHLHFSSVFFFSLALCFHFVGFTVISFLDRGGDGFLFELVFPRPNYSCPSVRPPSDSDVAATCSTVSHYLA